MFKRIISLTVCAVSALCLMGCEKSGSGELPTDSEGSTEATYGTYPIDNPLITYTAPTTATTTIPLNGPVPLATETAPPSTVPPTETSVMISSVSSSETLTSAVSSVISDTVSSSSEIPTSVMIPEPTAAVPQVPIPDVEGLSGTDKDLIGSWVSASDGLGFTFCENNVLMGSLDYTMYMHFNEEMEFCGDGMDEYPVEYDGENLSVIIQENGVTSELLTMKRTDEKNVDSLDGHYQLISGLLNEELYQQYRCILPIEVTVSGIELWLHFPDGYYGTDGKNITVLNSIFFGNDAVNGKYKVSGNSLMLTLNDKVTKLEKAS